MQRLRTTFKRSRTPTGADMKTQSSLEVPKQVRSASFDEIQLEAAREENESASFLSVPQPSTGRSRSFDSAGSDDSGTFLEVPRLFVRRRSGKNTPPPCVHCKYLEAWRGQTFTDRSPYTSSADDDDDDDDSDAKELPNIKLTLSPSTSFDHHDAPIFGSVGPPAFYLQSLYDDVEPMPTGRRRSISRQEAFFVEPVGNSLENMTASENHDETERQDVSDSGELLVNDIYLAVPDLKRDRAASVDSSLLKMSPKAEEFSGDLLSVPSTNHRSRSVDIVLPTADQARYKALAFAVPQTPVEQPTFSILDHRKAASVDSGSRVISNTPDWSENAVSGEHLWSPTSVSGDFCYVGDSDCQKHGPRMKCSACRIVVHSVCIDALYDRVGFMCKPTFRDVGIRQYREQADVHHHWTHRRSEKGKCKQCGKALQGKLTFTSKEIMALTCSWCKCSYHNKESCFSADRIAEQCTLGTQASIIVPPSWIVKLPRRGSFKSSLRKSPKKKSAGKKKSKDAKAEQKAFVVKPIPTSNTKPVLVFINPKSGGNQGAKLLQKFQWLLNPRQVFDLTQGGPGPGLELFRKVPNLRVLACGGDGTVGWVLSVLDKIGTKPAVGVLPLGTGNDLARALGWGGGYEDEPISKILANIGESDTVLLDRWQMDVTPNENAKDDEGRAKPNLPLNVFNNYFSFGVDAHIALEFHEAREAHPEKFNSRIRNKLFYGTAGGKDLMQRKWRSLADFVTMECDGKDLTGVLKEHRVHAIVFLNIPSYGGGTHPWNKSGGAYEPSTEDGMIEVVGLTTYQLPILQAGGHGTCITQCKTAKIVTTKVIPMQVDGEACRLAPSIINITRLNQAVMLAKRKPGRVNVQLQTLDKLTLTVNLVTMADYERHHYNKELLCNSAEKVATVDVNPAADLEQMRTLIQNLIKESQNYQHLTDWWFVDSCTAERFFRIDKAQENLYYVTDICNDVIFILDATAHTPEHESMPALDSTTSFERTGPSISLDTTIGQSISLDISQGLESSNAGGDSMDISDCNRDSSIGKIGTNLLGASPTEKNTHSPPFVTSPIGDSKFKGNFLEKTSDSLLKAAKSGDLLMVKELHRAGYSLLSIDESGQTALHVASRYGNKDVVKYLIAYAPTTLLNMRDNERGQTALHKAASYKRRHICCLLVAGGASLTVTDNAGLTPRQLAFRADDHDLANYLESQEHFQLISEDLETSV